MSVQHIQCEVQPQACTICISLAVRTSACDAISQTHVHCTRSGYVLVLFVTRSTSAVVRTK
jgi:hypothetical protein